MASIVELPRLSDTMEEGVIAKWHIAVGDKVKRGQVIADVETDKATMEFESFDSGIVLKLVASEGEAMPIGSPIAVFGKEGEDAEAALASHGGGGQAEAPKDEPEPEPEPKPEPEPAKQDQPKAEPAAPANEAPKAEPSAPVDDDRIAASPIARRLARDKGLKLSEIKGSGPHGRIVKTDVEQAEAAPAGATTSAPAAAAPSDSPFHKTDEPQKLSQMRKTIAKRMAQANSEIPHFYLTTTVDMLGVVKLREQLKKTLPDTKISFNDFIMLATAKALVQHPEVNAYWDGQTIVRRGDIHVGFAAAIDEGLVVPVVRFTNFKTLREVATEVRDLGGRAREKKLATEEMVGSSFTVSNLGMFGITEFSAVVNPGEGAILAVGAITDEVVVENGKPAVGKRMKMTLSCDHRVMDGAVGAQFLKTLRAYLESPMTILT